MTLSTTAMVQALVEDWINCRKPVGAKVEGILIDHYASMTDSQIRKAYDDAFGDAQ